MRALAALSLSVVALASASCASIVSDKHYPVTISASQPGTEVVVKDENGMIRYQGVTPTTITLPASDGYFDGQTYTVEAVNDADGDAIATLDSGVDGWYFGNLFFGGLIGFLIVDPATGAMYSLDEQIHLNTGPRPVAGGQ